MVEEHVSTTRTAQVRAQLRSEVLWGKLAPGERLRVSALANRLGVSSTVVREALTNLAEQGLVESTPRLGFTAMALSGDRFDDLTATRVDIERLVLEKAIRNGDVKWEAASIAAHHELAALSMMDEDNPGQLSDAWRIAHGNFHRTLASGCGSETLLAIRERLWNASEVYRILAFTNPSEETQQKNAKQHEDILEAALSRDVALALERTTAHTGTSMRALLEQARVFDKR